MDTGQGKSDGMTNINSLQLNNSFGHKNKNVNDPVGLLNLTATTAKTINIIFPPLSVHPMFQQSKYAMCLLIPNFMLFYLTYQKINKKEKTSGHMRDRQSQQ